VAGFRPRMSLEILTAEHMPYYPSMRPGWKVGDWEVPPKPL
jgi:hypothetical protein